MYNPYGRYPYSRNKNIPMNNTYDIYYDFRTYPYRYRDTIPPNSSNVPFTRFGDYGPEPFVVNIEEVTKQNNTFRTALWTGNHLQLTLMSINVGEDIGLEIHPNLDQFIRIEDGQGVVMMVTEKTTWISEKTYMPILRSSYRWVNGTTLLILVKYR